MGKLNLFILLIININFIYIHSFKNEKEKTLLYETEDINMIHFIKCGSSDSILIESNGKYGLVDSSFPYKYIENEVISVNIDEKAGEENKWSEDPNYSVQAVLNYLEFLKVNKLDFIIGTHSHADHIGGIPAVAYRYVDSNTKYYYRKYRITKEDVFDRDWANSKYFLAAEQSMEEKGAELIDVTDKNITFDFGDFHLELLNTEIDPEEISLGENGNSIGTLVTIFNTKIFLAADMMAKHDRKLKDYLGKIDILKLAHHGYSDSSYEFISTTKPDYVVISNNYLPSYSYSIVNYLKENYDSKIYLTENVPGTTEIVDKSAIKLNIEKGGNKFTFSNTGEEVNIGSNVQGWYTWCNKKVYLENGKTIKGWKELEWAKGKDWFYFNNEGLMVIGMQKLERLGNINWYYFDEQNGNMVTGWKTLNSIEGNKTFYFMPSSGTMVQNTCITIDDKNYCFDENGYLI